MTTALVGHSGFVGTTLLRQTSFDAGFRSTNIDEIRGRRFDLVVCAAAPAQKWLANKDPVGDRARIDALIERLDQVQADTFVLISTVDVYGNPVGVDEESPVHEEGLHAYGLNRRLLEKFVEQKFARHVVVRLPGLVGPGLRKNIIYDLQHGNAVSAIDSRSRFQFYPMINLWSDTQQALTQGLSLVHLTAAPVSVAEVALEGFGRTLEQHQPGTPAAYDFQSRHAALFGGAGRYQYSRRESLMSIRAYAQSEPVKAKDAGAAS